MGPRNAFLFVLITCVCGGTLVQEDPSSKIFSQLMQFVFDPKAATGLKTQGDQQWGMDWFDESDVVYQNYSEVVQRGLRLTPKQIPFDLYNLQMLTETKAFVKLLSNCDLNKFMKTVAWARNNVNEGIFLYSVRAALLFSPLGNFVKIQSPPRLNPYFYFNAESLNKINKFNAKKVDPVNIHKFEMIGNEMEIGENGALIVKGNYSGWNLVDNACEKIMSYFREDPALNSQFLGMNLIHPFWMSDEELNQYNPKQAELYAFHLNQLISRYSLEREANGLKNNRELEEVCEFADYHPYLEYPNGNMFPVRKNFRKTFKGKSMESLRLTVDSIQDIISNGFYVTKDETVNLTRPEHLPILVQLMRKYLDNFQMGQAWRNILSDQSQSSTTPSALNHPETALRDPIFWKIISAQNDLIKLFKIKMEPRDFSTLNDPSIVIESVDVDITPTYFKGIPVDVTNAVFTNEFTGPFKHSNQYYVNQKRLTHDNFTVTINLQSAENYQAIVKIFIGPQCNESNNMCTYHWDRMFQVDVMRVKLFKGENVIQWYDTGSNNLLQDKEEDSHNNNYNIHIFPRRLVVPKGNEEGLPLTVFVSVNRDTSEIEVLDNTETMYYKKTKKLDDKPAGYPFDIPFKTFEGATNFMFVPVKIHHKDVCKTY